MGIDRTVGKEEEPRAPAAAQRGSRKLSKTAARPRDSSCGRKGNIDSLLGSKNRGELRQLTSRNHGTGKRDSIFQVNIERHHVSLAQWIDRRVGDLREPLLAVIPQSPWKRGKKRGRRVVSHAPIRFFAAGQRGKENLELIVGPAGSARDALWVIDGNQRYGGWSCQHSLRNGVARLMDCKALENVAPAQKEPGSGIGKDHFSGAEPLALSDTRFFQIDQAGLGPGNQQAIMCKGVAQRAQAIAVQLRSYKLAIREHQRRGTIPRFALLRNRGQRTANVPRKQGIFLKGRRNHGEHGFFR